MRLSGCGKAPAEHPRNFAVFPKDKFSAIPDRAAILQTVQTLNAYCDNPGRGAR